MAAAWKLEAFWAKRGRAFVKVGFFDVSWYNVSLCSLGWRPDVLRFSSRAF